MAGPGQVVKSGPHAIAADGTFAESGRRSFAFAGAYRVRLRLIRGKKVVTQIEFDLPVSR